MLRSLFELGQGVIADANDRNADLIAAGVAFYALFALFPGLAALIAVLGLLADPVVVEDQLALMRDVVPDEAYGLVATQIDSLLVTSPDALTLTTLLSLGVALWSARLGVAALIRGLNAIFDVPDRSGLRHLGVALLLTLGLVGMGIVAMLAVVVAPVVIALLPLGPTEAMALTAIRWIVALGVIVLGLGLLFRWGPNRGGDRPRLITPGSLLVAPLWLAASAALSAYVAGFGTYNEVYGSIGVVIVLLLWFWVSAYLVLLGAALDRRLHARR
ncbi:MAG: membrane protein [Rhodobacteraceae bacterium HLUCCA08]|nr:MAG: membrane protein [Rhodobacteraceae bacterium HLUCCA08]